jgi:hypothetical protein
MIAIIIVQTINHTQTITIGSIAVCKFLTISSISLFIFALIFIRSFAIVHVSSHIFTTEANSIGNKKFSFQLCISFIHISVLSSIHFDTLEVISLSSFS